MTERAIPFASPILGEAEQEAVLRVLAGPQLVHGPVAAELERRFAERVGSAHAISTSSCTAALHLSLLVADIGPGDEVLVPAMTHVATGHSVEYCGATPVFVDADPATGNIDPAGVEQAITANTRAAIVVHYLGLPCELDPIGAAIEGAGGFVVEDAATALDATYGDRRAGSIGRTGCFSFYPTKHMTTAEGGMLVTDDDAVAAAVRQRKAFGYDKMLGERSRPGVYDVTALGYNFRMSELHAAVGLAQLDRLDDFAAARASNFARLEEALRDVDELTVMPSTAGAARSSHYCLNAVLPRDGSIERDDVVRRLTERGIGTSVHYPGALPLFTYYREKYGYRAGQFPVAEWLAAQSISLPVGPHLGPDDPDRIAAALKDAVLNVRKGSSS